MKKYIYILLTFCLLSSCMEDPTAGVVVPKYNPSTGNPEGPGEEPGNELIDPAEPLDRGFIHLKGRELKSLNSISITGLNDGEKYNRQIKKFPTEKQNVSLKHILT